MRVYVEVFANLKNCCRVLAVVLALLFCVAPIFAQSTTDGAIGGTVIDKSGGVIGKAAVKTTNLGTAGTATGETDSSGRYLIIHLQPGSYSLEITAAGFGIFKQTDIIVEVGRVTSIDATLPLARQTSQVVVTGEAPVITTDRPDFTTNVNQAEIDDLPMNGRRWSFFALSTPGAVPDGGFGLVSFRGISGLLNNNTVDGADNNQAFFSEERGRTRISYSTSEAAIQEFQVNTSNYSAEYGRAAGGVVNAVTKSGTNVFHGEAFWFDRNSDWGAINPFQLHLVNGQEVPFLPEDKRHQFGGALGGPVIKDKLFFFFSADQQLRPFPAVANSGTPGAIFAPLSAAETATLTARGVLPGNAAAVNDALTLLTDLTGTVPRRGDQLVLLPKLDWVVDSKNHLTLSYNRFRWSSPEGIQTAPIVNRGIESFGNDYVKDDWGVARLITTLSPVMTNELRYQYGRDFEFEFGQASIPGEPISQLGFSPQVSVGGVGGWTFGMPNFLQRPKYPDEVRQQVADTLTWTRGTHLLKFGFDINHVNDSEINLFEGFGAYSYNTRVDYISDFVANATESGPFCGTVAAPLPCYASLSQGFGTPGFTYSTNDLAFFVQDDWRVRPRLTINLGLRWETEILPAPQIPNSTLPLTNTFPSDHTDFGPRIGAAWDITGNGRTVLRGGYGIYYGRIINSTIFNAIGDTGLPLGQNTVTLLPGQPGAPIYPNIIPSGSAPPGLSVVQFAPLTRLPLVHEYDLEVEREIAANTVVSISYIGSLGRRLPQFVDTNLAQPTQTTAYTILGGPLNGQVLDVPFFGVPNTLTGTRRPNTGFGSITDITYDVESHYNAMVLTFNRRFYKNFQIQSSYTFSRAMDDGQSSQTFTATNNVLNPFDLSAEYGRSDFDIHHRFTFEGIFTSDYYHGDNILMKYLINGFTLSPLINVSSGAPYTATISGNAPNQLANGTICTSAAEAGCFVAVTGGTGVLADGGTNRPPFFEPNSFQLPRTVDVDLRLQKAFTISERFKLTLIGDAFNLFNHNNITAASTEMFSVTSITDPANAALKVPALQYQDGQSGRTLFGSPTASSNSLIAQRQIQVGIKFDW